MATAQYAQALEIAEKLSPADRARLVRKLSEPHQAPPAERRRSILELKGLGAEIWEGVDAQEYVNAERATWER